MAVATGAERSLEAAARNWAFFASLGLAVMAFSVLLGGWVAGWEVLVRIHPDFSAMVPSTATCLLISAAALLASARTDDPLSAGRTVILRIASALTAAVSAVNLIVILTASSAGIDALIWPAISDPLHSSQAPATSLCFLLAAAGMARLSLPERDRDTVFTLIATTGLLLASIAVVGYAFDSTALYAVSLFTAMALHTAIGFVTLFIVLLLRRPSLGWVGLLLGPGSGSAGARRVFPVMIFGSFALCLLAYAATEAGLFTANFRLSVLAILIMALLAATILRNATLENRAEQEIVSTMDDLRISLNDRDLLLRELNHRVKNNLQQIMALIWFQAASIKDPAAKTAFRDTVGRIQALSTVHRLLLAGPAPSTIGTAYFFDDLCNSIATAYNVVDRNIEIAVEVEDARLDTDIAITVGLLLNELLSNAIKHAFPTGHGGTVTVRFARNADGGATLTVSDNGTGQARGDGSPTPEKGVGMQIIDGLVQQLRAVIAWQDGAGTTVTVSMPAGYEKKDHND